MIEIRWHGRAGQGAKTASLLLASAAMAEGRDVQAFPEYGPERRRTVRAYTRIDTRKIRRRYGITELDVVVVLDESLLQEANPTEGLRDGGLIVGSERDLDRAICIPASRIAAQGAGFVNVVMLGAISAALGEPALEAVLAAAACEGVAVDDVEAGFGPWRSSDARLEPLGRPRRAPRLRTGGWRTQGSRSPSWSAASTARSAGCTAPTPRSCSTARRSSASTSTSAKAARSAEICPVQAIRMVAE